MLQEAASRHGLREVKELHGATLHALDGEIGRVDEILFDDERWTVRYLIVHTGSWLFGRRVLISPLAFGLLDWERHTLNVNLTREQIKNSPDVDTDKPVSRQWETNYYSYYGWPYYWGGMGGMGGLGGLGGLGGAGGWGSYWYPGELLSHPVGSAVNPQQADEARADERNDAHLRSTKQMTGYKIAATDGHIGHIEDFIVDDATWGIRYLAVDTRDWWPGKKVLLPPDWISAVSWLDHSVTVNVTREQVRNAPEWDAGQPINRAVEDQLNGYYAQSTMRREFNKV